MNLKCIYIYIGLKIVGTKQQNNYLRISALRNAPFPWAKNCRGTVRNGLYMIMINNSSKRIVHSRCFCCTITMWYFRENRGMASVGCDSCRHLESSCWKCCAINRFCVLEAHVDKIDSCCNVTKKYAPPADKVRQKQRPDAAPQTAIALWTLFCAAADLARGVVGPRISYLLKRQCKNLQKIWVPRCKQRTTANPNTNHQQGKIDTQITRWKVWNRHDRTPLHSALLHSEIA